MLSKKILEVYKSNLYKRFDGDIAYYFSTKDFPDLNEIPYELMEGLNIDKANTYLPNGMVEDAEAECERYEALIASLGGIDLQLLGFGHNGHIGFNEPSDHFEKGTYCVSLTERTIEANKRFFESADDVPRQAFTMGIGTIMAAKKIVVVVSGEDKADAVKACLTGPITPAVQGSILQLHPDVTIVCDEAAYSKITE